MMPCSPELKACVDALVADGKPEDSAWAICRSKLGESVRRSRDFQRIYDEFTRFYPTTQEAETQYYEWLGVMELDETREYGQTRESYLWTRDDIQFVSEDEDSKYYEVEIGFPTSSMNGNVYKKRDLIAASLSLAGKSPSLNHKSLYWFSSKNPRNRWGNIEIVKGAFHENRSKALVKVPKNMVCPVCDGGLMTDLIDSKRIYNVSLEGECRGGVCDSGECEGFYYLDPPFTFLTSDVLPGIPMTRIKPIEALLPFSRSQKTGEKKKMVIKPKIVEHTANTADAAEPNVNVHSRANPDFRGTSGTPVDADAKIDSQNDLATAVVGTPAFADNTSMKIAAPTASTPHHTSLSEKQAEESDEPEYAGVPPSTGSDETVPKPEDIRTGPHRTSPPTSDIPSAGDLPEPEKPDVETGEAPTDAQTVPTGESPVERLPSLEERRARVHAELKAKSSEEQALAWEQKHNEIFEKYASVNAAYRELKRIHEDAERKASRERDQHSQRLQNVTVRMEQAVSDYNAACGEKAKVERKLEELKASFDDANRKYQETLGVNLELSKKLTKANEDYLDVAKQLEETKEALTKAQVQAKKIVRIKA